MLTRTSQYALQAIVYLAEHVDSGAIPSWQVASEAGVPRKYLSTVLSTLVRKGILTASPGKKGGYQLAQVACEIPLWDVLEPFEPLLATRRPCPFGKKSCDDMDPCDGHSHWSKVRKSYLVFVHETSVRDIIAQDKRDIDNRNNVEEPA